MNVILVRKYCSVQLIGDDKKIIEFFQVKLAYLRFYGRGENVPLRLKLGETR